MTSRNRQKKQKLIARNYRAGLLSSFGIILIFYEYIRELSPYYHFLARNDSECIVVRQEILLTRLIQYVLSCLPPDFLLRLSQSLLRARYYNSS